MKNQTFQQMIDNGYTFPEEIDQLTQELIIEWFMFREISSNNRFVVWFNRSLSLNYKYYRQLMRIDPTVSEFDWLIENYVEKQNTIQSTNVNDRKEENTTQNDRVHNSTNNGSFENNNTNTGTTGSKNEGYERNNGFSRVAPMSQEYDTLQMTERDGEKISVGENTISNFANAIPYPRISNPTSSQDTLTKHGNIDEQKTSSTDNANGTTTNTENATTGTTGSYKGSSNNTNKTDSVFREILSGRNVPLAELLNISRNYILNSKAWNYLYKELDKCFMLVYESEEE